MSEIITKSTASNREITTVAPAFTMCESLAELVAQVGEDLVLKYATDQIIIAYRAMIRNRLDAKDEKSGEPKYTDELILQVAADWKPSLRTVKSATEKLQEQLGNMKVEDILKAFQSQPELLAQLGVNG